MSTIESQSPTPIPPQPMKAVLVTAPQYPLGTLYYVWKQSRHNRELPTPEELEHLLTRGLYLKQLYTEHGQLAAGTDWNDADICHAHKLGFEPTLNGIIAAAKHIRDEIEMILHEGIPVVENLNFVFHLQNIPISLREQLVRHRIGVALDPRVGADIVPLSMMEDAPKGALMEMRTIPNLAESSWWSQTSRVIPFNTFYDEGRYILPEGLKGKMVTDQDGDSMPAEELYLLMMESIQEAYKCLMDAGVHIEDCRQLIPVGATHGITWSINLKAMLHIFGKRSSWIAQIGIWGDIMGQMADELVKKVHPMMRMVLMPQCISKGKYIGCPVSGTNAERVAGVDGMPPCPLWVRYETDKAVEAEVKANNGEFPGREVAAWSSPKHDEAPGAFTSRSEETKDIRNWKTDRPVEREMLERTAGKYSKLWGFDVMEGVPELEETS